MAKKYLDNEGLLYFWQKIKSKFVAQESGKGLSTNDYTTTEKNKLSGIAAGAEVNQNAFSNVKVGSTTVAADGKTDTLELVAGSNVTLTPDATNDKVTIAATQAVTSVAGKTGAVTLDKGDVGLGNVDNTADANKWVKGAQYLSEGAVVDGLYFDGGMDDGSETAYPTHYCVCSTAAGTAAKTVSNSNLMQRNSPGAIVLVKFTTTNTAAVANLTLKVGAGSALPIKYRGGNLPSAGTLTAGRIYAFVHDGTNWELIGDLDTNTTYSKCPNPKQQQELQQQAERFQLKYYRIPSTIR